MKKKILYFDLDVQSTDFVQTLLKDQMEYELTVINSFPLFKDIISTQAKYDLVIFHLWEEHPAIRNRFLKAFPIGFKNQLLQLSLSFEVHPDYPSLIHFEIPGDIDSFIQKISDCLKENKLESDTRIQLDQIENSSEPLPAVSSNETIPTTEKVNA